MPVLPKEETEGVRTRSQRQQDVDQRRFGDAPSPSSGGHRDSTAAAEPAQSSASPDLAALMAFMQEQARRQEEQARRQEEQARRQEEQARRQEEQARRLEEQMQRDKEEQARRQEEQARRQEEQARRLEEQLQRDKEEQARRQEEQLLVIKDLRGAIGKELKEVKDQVQQQEIRIAELEKIVRGFTSGGGAVAAAVVAPSPGGFKVPPFDGSSSWSAYKIQFEAVMKSNRWTKEQALTALTLGLRDQALTVLEALGQNFTFEKLLEALEARYGDAHLEHVFRAQLKVRSQRVGETLQQWALEVEKLVRKAYQSSPVLIDGNLVQAFTDGIRDLEVRAAVRLGHFKNLKNALAYALEVEAVRRDDRAHRIREDVSSPRCYSCGERGHIRLSCPKRRSPHCGIQLPAAGKPVDARTKWRLVAGDGRAPRNSISQIVCESQSCEGNKTPHGNADALSRRSCSNQCKPCARQEAEQVTFVRMLRTDLSEDWKGILQSAQQDDRDIKPILEWKKLGAPRPRWSDVAAMSSITKSYWAQWESLVIQDGVLCRKWENARGDQCHLQMVVPKFKVPEVLQLYHNGSSGSHMGVKRTLIKIRERFYWIHCREDVKEWCRKCTSCAGAPVKGPHTRSRGALKVYEHIRETGQQMSARIKTRYERKANNKGFDEGSLVWLHNPVHSKGKLPKLQAKWDGPYRVVTKINDVTYRI